MDSEPSSISVIFSPSSPRKRKSLDLGALKLPEKQCILNMYKKLTIDEPNMKITAIISKIANTIGVAISTVYKIIKEYKETGEICSPKWLGGRRAIITSFGDEIKSSVRQIVHSFFYKNELPTLDKILKEIENHPNITKMSRCTLYTFMKQINFQYLHDEKP